LFFGCAFPLHPKLFCVLVALLFGLDSVGDLSYGGGNASKDCPFGGGIGYGGGLFGMDDETGGGGTGTVKLFASLSRGIEPVPLVWHGGGGGVGGVSPLGGKNIAWSLCCWLLEVRCAAMLCIRHISRHSADTRTTHIVKDFSRIFWCSECFHQRKYVSGAVAICLSFGYLSYLLAYTGRLSRQDTNSCPILIAPLIDSKKGAGRSISTKANTS
jgi:hypothetical protein